jgi:hypothetical protein
MHPAEAPSLPILPTDAVHSQIVPLHTTAGLTARQLDHSWLCASNKGVTKQWKLENQHLGHTFSRAFSQKSSLWGPSAQSATFTLAISTCSPLDGSSKTLARRFIVKKKPLRPLHTPRDTFVHFTPHAPLPTTAPILNILAPKAYHWIARNCLRTMTSLQQHIIYRQSMCTTRELAQMLLITVYIPMYF